MPQFQSRFNVRYGTAAPLANPRKKRALICHFLFFERPSLWKTRKLALEKEKQALEKQALEKHALEKA
jgi:hypothetical protein